MQQSIGPGAMKNASLRIAVVVTATVLGVLTVLGIAGMLTPRSFGIAGLAAMVVCGSVWYFAVKSVSRSTDASASQNQNTRTGGKGFYFQIAVFLIFLAFAAWATRGGPWLPRLLGASMLVLFGVGALRARR